MKYSIVIPCYNEKENLNSLVDCLVKITEKFNAEFILVENGSTDGSRSYFKQCIEDKYNNIKCVFIKNNQGYGYGIQQGLKKALGEYVGWIHADMQFRPDGLITFFDYLEEKKSTEKYFIKGIRTNRTKFDVFFTKCQAIVDSCIFNVKLFDITAIPVIFNRELMDNIDEWPNDFSIELYAYYKAIKCNYHIYRKKIVIVPRKQGKSSWNKGLESKIKLGIKIFADSIKIKQGKKVE